MAMEAMQRVEVLTDLQGEAVIDWTAKVNRVVDMLRQEQSITESQLLFQLRQKVSEKHHSVLECRAEDMWRRRVTGDVKDTEVGSLFLLAICDYAVAAKKRRVSEMLRRLENMRPEPGTLARCSWSGSRWRGGR